MENYIGKHKGNYIGNCIESGLKLRYSFSYA